MNRIANIAPIDLSEVARLALPHLWKKQSFREWFGSSKVMQDDGTPMLVFRGEHALPSPGKRFMSRLGSLSFASHEIAMTYATSPNHRRDEILLPRILPALLRIENPFPCDREDPFVEFSKIIEHLGVKKAHRIASALQDSMHELGQWVEDDDGLYNEFEGVSDLLARAPDRLAECYVDAYLVFDSPEFCQWFAKAGFDGVIHGGNGESALEPEYKVFDHRSAFCPADWATPARKTTPRLAIG